MGFRVLSRPDPSIMTDKLDPLAGRIEEERVLGKTPMTRQRESFTQSSNFDASALVVTPRAPVASMSSGRSPVPHIETGRRNGPEASELYWRQKSNVGGDTRGNNVPLSNASPVANTVFEEPFGDSDQEDSTGSQTPRRREGTAVGFGFSVLRSSSNAPDSSGNASQPGPAISAHAMDQKPHRRPSLLTQQILSSPAVPLATRSNASSKQPELILQKRPSLKDRVKGGLISNGNNSRDVIFSAGETRGGRTEYSAATPSQTGASSVSDTRSRKGSTGTHMSSRPSIEEHLEELVEDTSPHDYRGRPKRNIRRRTYNEGSSQDDLGSAFSHGTGGSVWDRSVTGFTTDDDEGVIETQDINFTKDARTGRKMINQYVILREIGRGQHGQVRLGQDTTALETVRTGDGPPPATHSPPSENASHSRTLSWAENLSSGTEYAASPATMSPAGAGFWAIKIMDRQPRKKLPGVKKLTSSQPEEAKQATFTNEKLKKEIAILKKCRHPNVVRLREVIDAPASKKIYLVLEYCEGGEVKWKTDDGRPLLTLDQARRILRDIVLGLEYLHHQGIIHRDIKPANLLYTADGVVKISDFGVSHYSHVLRGQQTGEEEFSPEDGDELGFANEHDLAKTAGSPAFFAPELCFSDLGPPSGGSSPSRELSTYAFPLPSDLTAGSRSSLHSAHSASHTLRPRSPIPKRERPPITEAIDIWALGVTLYCFLFARVPFDSTSEFHLLSIIPTEDFAIPKVMGANAVPTGGRNGYLKGASAGLSQEACETIDLLTRLLEKDPLKRIKLADVKKHPFTLRGLSDTSAWLKSTDSTSRNTVMVSHAEVAAAVTNSGSFREKFRKGFKILSNRIFGNGSGNSPVPHSKPRSRSHSVVQTGETSSLGTSGDQATGARSNMGSLNRSQSRLASGWPQRVASPYFDREKRTASPVPGGLVRRLSMLGSKSSRSISPLPPSDPSAHLSARRGTTASLHSDANQLGRSVSDRSTASSVGVLSLSRIAPIRRQSTQLVPPVVGDFELSASSGRKGLSTTNSVERLNASTQPPSNLDREQLDDRDVKPRERAFSNASSIAGIPPADLHTKFSRLVARRSSQNSTSAASAGLKPTDSSHDVGSSVGFDNRVSRDEANGRPRSSGDTLLSQSAASLSLKSPMTLSRGLPELPVLAPLTLDDSASYHHALASPSAPGDIDVDKADWEGDLSDDDEDYGEPIRRPWGGASSQHDDWDRTPQNVQDLDNGTWVLNGQGWRSNNEAGSPESAAQVAQGGSAVHGDLQLDTGNPKSATRFPEADVPATIAETDAELEAETINERSVLRSPIGHLSKMPKDDTMSITSSPPYQNDPLTVRDTVSASPSNPRSPQRANDRSWISPISHNDMFDDADEDDEDDGLEIDVGLKRGRRSSKPLTPAMNSRASLPST